jgi:MoxR-vWA-beta-propeller ternary system domain bpX2
VADAEGTVNFPWAICLAQEDAASLGALRLADSIEVAEHGGTVWLRGKPADERLAAKLHALPARERYECLASGQLRRVDQRIPTARLPAAQWQPLTSWLQVMLPDSAFPAELPRAVPLRLVRSTSEREPELLLTGLEELARFAATAPQVRLGRLQFAANANGSALVRGQPLPPLPGERYVMHSGVAVPAGFSWKPEVATDVLARRLGVSADALVLWNADGSITRFHSEQFVPLSRSAVRATALAGGIA